MIALDSITQSLRKRLARGWVKTRGARFERLADPDPDVFPQLAGYAAYANNTYLVLSCGIETPWGEASHLHVQRWDTKRVRSWGALQDIKNQLCGPEAVAIEMYPAEGDVVDECHHYHLWVLPSGLDLECFNLRGGWCVQNH